MIFHGNWALGEAVVFPGSLCAINQVDGGGEWCAAFIVAAGTKPLPRPVNGF